MLGKDHVDNLHCLQHCTHGHHLNSMVKSGIIPGGLPGSTSQERNSVHLGAFRPFDKRLMSGARKGGRTDGNDHGSVHQENTATLNNAFVVSRAGAIMTNTVIPPWCFDYSTRFHNEIERMQWDSSLVGCRPMESAYGKWRSGILRGRAAFHAIILRWPHGGHSRGHSRAAEQARRAPFTPMGRSERLQLCWVQEVASQIDACIACRRYHLLH